MSLALQDVIAYADAVDTGPFLYTRDVDEAVELLAGQTGRTVDQTREDVRRWRDASVSLQGLDPADRQFVRQLVDRLRG